jgi:archaellum component FlaC
LLETVEALNSQGIKQLLERYEELTRDVMTARSEMTKITASLEDLVKATIRDNHEVAMSGLRAHEVQSNKSVYSYDQLQVVMA